MVERGEKNNFFVCSVLMLDILLKRMICIWHGLNESQENFFVKYKKKKKNLEIAPKKKLIYLHTQHTRTAATTAAVVGRWRETSADDGVAVYGSRNHRRCEKPNRFHWVSGATNVKKKRKEKKNTYIRCVYCKKSKFPTKKKNVFVTNKRTNKQKLLILQQLLQYTTCVHSTHKKKIEIF